MSKYWELGLDVAFALIGLAKDIVPDLLKKKVVEHREVVDWVVDNVHTTGDTETDKADRDLNERIEGD